MRVSLSKRILSYLIDAVPLLLVVLGLHTLFIGGIIENQIPNYDDNKEVKDAMKEFKPSTYKIANINGLYKIYILALVRDLFTVFRL